MSIYTVGFHYSRVLCIQKFYLPEWYKIVCNNIHDPMDCILRASAPIMGAGCITGEWLTRSQHWFRQCPDIKCMIRKPQIARFMGPTWAPYGPHEPCYQGHTAWITGGLQWSSNSLCPRPSASIDTVPGHPHPWYWDSRSPYNAHGNAHMGPMCKWPWYHTPTGSNELDLEWIHPIVKKFQHRQGSIYYARMYAHVAQMGKWPWCCTSTGRDSCNELDLEWIGPADVRASVKIGPDGQMDERMNERMEAIL